MGTKRNIEIPCEKEVIKKIKRHADYWGTTTRDWIIYACGRQIDHEEQIIAEENQRKD